METFFNILSVIGTVSGVAAGILVAFFKQSAQTYTDEKAKNLATIEDTEKITKKVEAVRAAIDLQSHVKKTIFEKEYQLLQDVWKTAWDYQAAVKNLRPILDHLPMDKEEQWKILLERYDRLRIKTDAFIEIIVKSKPFIPDSIYQSCDQLWKMSIPLRVDFEMTVGKIHSSEPNWDKISEYGDKIDILINEISRTIRTYLFPDQ